MAQSHLALSQQAKTLESRMSADESKLFKGLADINITIRLTHS